MSLTKQPTFRIFAVPWVQSIALSAALLPAVYFTLLPLPAADTHANHQKARSNPTQTGRAHEALGRLPLSFQPNRGQFAAPVKFAARGRGYQIALTPRETVIALTGQSCADERGAQRSASACQPSPASEVRLSFARSNPEPELVGESELPGKVNYFIGNDPKQWLAGVPTYEKVRARAVYPGVDVVFYSHQRQLEYDLIVAPGSDPRQIKLVFTGTSAIRLDSRGELALETASGELRQRPPIIFQESAGQRRFVAGRYVKTGEHEIGFELGEYDPELPLVIDPVLVYSTYLGGGFTDTARGLAADATGVYLTGNTESYDLPGVPLLSVNRGVYKSVDGGATWNGSNQGLASAGVFSLAFAPSNPALLYASSNRLYKSTDGGNTWSVPTNNGLLSLSYNALAIDPTNPNIVYLASNTSTTGSGVFKSIDGGNNWTVSRIGLPSVNFFALVVDPGNTATIYAAIPTRLYPFWGREVRPLNVKRQVRPESP